MPYILSHIFWDCNKNEICSPFPRLSRTAVPYSPVFRPEGDIGRTAFPCIKTSRRPENSLPASKKFRTMRLPPH